MPTIKGTDGDTTGALVTNITTPTQLTALINPASESLDGGMSAADKTEIDSIAAVSSFSPSAITFSAPLAVPSYVDSSRPTQAWMAGGFTTPTLIDLTTTGTYVLIPPAGFRLAYVSFYFVTKTATAVTVSPTFSIGSNSPSFNNLCASQTPPTANWQSLTRLIPTAVGSGINPMVDLTASGLVLNVTGGATATVLTAEFVVEGALIPV